MGFSRQEYWSGLTRPPAGDLSNPGIEPRSPSLQADSLSTEPPGKPKYYLTLASIFSGCLSQGDTKISTPMIHCDTMGWEAGKGGFRHSPRLHNGRAWICTLASWRALKSEPLGSGSWKEAWASLLCCFTVKLRIQAREEFLILVTCKVITQISKHAVTPGPLTDKQIHLEARNVTIKEGLNY